MAALVIRQPVSRQSPTPPLQESILCPVPPRPGSAPVPNKHIPYCPTGPLPIQGSPQRPATPPDSPPSQNSSFQPLSYLQPADRFPQISRNPPVYSINASDLVASVENLAAQPLPDPKHVFPWLHGLSAENQMQLAFFSVRRKIQRSTPKCYRGLTIVKTGGDLSRARITSAVSPEEVLEYDENLAADANFLDVDPREGFSIRNFQIQSTKMAVLSDIVIYRDEDTSYQEVYELAKRFSRAQDTWRIVSRGIDNEFAPKYSTFVLNSSFASIEADYPSLVAVDSEGAVSGQALDLSRLERQEMCKMSKASEIANNVWLGPTPDSGLDPECNEIDNRDYDIVIEATDVAQVPSKHLLKRISQMSHSATQHMEFPASGSLLAEVHTRPQSDPLIKMCQWIHQLANPDNSSESSGEEEMDEDGDIQMKTLHPKPRKFLLHCTDGYTETTLLALAYFMYAEQIPLHTALIRLHCLKNRNFFAYPSDVPLLCSIQPYLIRRTVPKTRRGRSASLKLDDEPSWLSRIDGSLPSRILPHMYLGNLAHANNPELLRAMGIKQILSVGEPVNWPRGQFEAWGRENILSVDDVQDNGVDSLTRHFDRCLDFITQGAAASPPTATLVHCRVGVSRSATICIAAVMSTLNLSFPRAYCYVRARRLNVIIQPHLRFAYELMKWDEVCQMRRGEPVRREMDWAAVAREVGRLNAPYCSRQ